MQGMAPTPDQLAKQRELKEKNGEEPEGPKSMVEGPIPVLSPLFKSEISQLIYGIGWAYNKRVLDHMEVLCNNDRTWVIVRKIAMGIMTEQIETQQKIIGQKIRELQMKAKEIADDDGSNGSTSTGNA
jgi:hypothetical protein